MIRARLIFTTLITCYCGLSANPAGATSYIMKTREEIEKTNQKTAQLKEIEFTLLDLDKDRNISKDEFVNNKQKTIDTIRAALDNKGEYPEIKQSYYSIFHCWPPRSPDPMSFRAVPAHAPAPAEVHTVPRDPAINQKAWQDVLKQAEEYKRTSTTPPPFDQEAFTNTILQHMIKNAPVKKPVPPSLTDMITDDRLFVMLDSDANGVVSEEEYRNFNTGVAYSFIESDRDRDFQVSAKEFEDYPSYADLYMVDSPKKRSIGFFRRDANRDGSLSWQETTQFYSLKTKDLFSYALSGYEGRFLRSDTNIDGYISAPEYLAMDKSDNMPSEVSTQAFSLKDSNKDQYLSFEEYSSKTAFLIDHFYSIARYRDFSVEDYRQPMTVDYNAISKEQFNKFLGSAKKQRKEKVEFQPFEQYDLNSDGNMTLEEFIANNPLNKKP